MYLIIKYFLIESINLFFKKVRSKIIEGCKEYLLTFKFTD